jgi:GR25 family glycosyltransferase involved in LPS biosynthesis
VRLYSLQKGPRLSELKENGAEAYIEDIGSRCEDFADTAAAIENLDLVVMTDSSVAHLAGSLGKPVLDILPKVPYWLYTLDQHITPWYPSMRFIPCEQFAQWIETIFCDINAKDIEYIINRHRQVVSIAQLQMRAINLDRRPDRWRQFLTQNAFVHNIIRQSAVDAETLDMDALVKQHILHASAADAHRAEIACALSHREAWLTAVQRDIPQLVMEDDVILRKDIEEKLIHVMASAPPEWDFILLGFNTDSILDIEIFDNVRMQSRFCQFDNQLNQWQPCSNMLDKSAIFVHTRNTVSLFKIYHAFGLASYLISAKGARKLLKNCFPLRPTSCRIAALGRTLNSVALDIVLNTQYSKIEAYCVVPPLALPVNDKTQSDIQRGG